MAVSALLSEISQQWMVLCSTSGALLSIHLDAKSLAAHDQRFIRRMASSGMLHHVALVRTDVSEELSASIIRVTRIAELGTLDATVSC
jgi:hypothetical protein